MSAVPQLETLGNKGTANTAVAQADCDLGSPQETTYPRPLLCGTVFLSAVSPGGRNTACKAKQCHTQALIGR